MTSLELQKIILERKPKGIQLSGRRKNLSIRNIESNDTVLALVATPDREGNHEMSPSALYNMLKIRVSDYENDIVMTVLDEDYPVTGYHMDGTDLILERDLNIFPENMFQVGTRH